MQLQENIYDPDRTFRQNQSPSFFLQLVLLMKDYKAGHTHQMGDIDLDLGDM